VPNVFFWLMLSYPGISPAALYCRGWSWPLSPLWWCGLKTLRTQLKTLR
jgi:hypothetical protein